MGLLSDFFDTITGNENRDDRNDTVAEAIKNELEAGRGRSVKLSLYDDRETDKPKKVDRPKTVNKLKKR